MPAASHEAVLARPEGTRTTRRQPHDAKPAARPEALAGRKQKEDRPAQPRRTSWCRTETSPGAKRRNGSGTFLPQPTGADTSSRHGGGPGASRQIAWAGEAELHRHARTGRDAWRPVPSPNDVTKA